MRVAPFVLRSGLVALSVATIPAVAQGEMPRDVDCAATFTLLAHDARAHGMDATGLERMAGTARAANHGGNEQAAMARVRTMDLPSLQGQLVNCHARYGKPVRTASN